MVRSCARRQWRTSAAGSNHRTRTTAATPGSRRSRRRRWPAARVGSCDASMAGGIRRRQAWLSQPPALRYDRRMTATQIAAPGGTPQLINWWNLRWVALALAVMVAAIVAGNAFFLNFVHVMSGVMWTGIDIFMGFVIGPVLRQTDVPARRAIAVRLIPRMLF